DATPNSGMEDFFGRRGFVVPDKRVLGSVIRQTNEYSLNRELGIFKRITNPYIPQAGIANPLRPTRKNP
ncbi:MAG: hypothetical protein LUH15_09640, partial [Tannerellaceae bacterium]|nr:hypothetical protein [Tannerellaceae bacterium]